MPSRTARTPYVFVPSLLLLLVAVASCGPATPAPGGPATIGSGAGSSSAPPPELSKDKTLCERVCGVQARCGTNKETCLARCRPIARVLATDVVEAMVACVEGKASPTCEPGDAGVKARQQLVGACVVEATDAKQDAAGANIDLFANAVCERTQQCGVVGVFSKPQCLGEGRAAIRDTGSIGIYGALRPSSVDELVTCLEGRKCEGRDKDAAMELKVCLDDVLASAAEAK